MAICLRSVRITFVLLVCFSVPALAFVEEMHEDMKENLPAEKQDEESSPSIEGSVETAGNVYATYNRYRNSSKLQYRVFENVTFDATFDQNWFFRFNSRIIYQTQKGGATGNWVFNFFYGYLDFSGEKIGFQLGRIMDFNNLVYLCFDGLNLESTIGIGDHRLSLDLYGGFIVRDDYLEEYRNPWVLRSFNGTDYRNIFIRQRMGDYIAGFKAEFFAKNAGIFGVEYQLVFNRNAIAEHYASLNFDTMFSKVFKLYGYGTLDLVELRPSNTLFGVQVDPLDLLSLVFEHEYYRPVFIKNSYFWTYFEPFGNQEASATLVIFVSKLLTIDIKYGAVIYDGEPNIGNDVSCNLEHRDFFGFGVRIGAEMIVGPEGNLITCQTMIKRRISVFDFLAGGGGEFYNEKSLAAGLSAGYFATLGVDVEIVKSLVLSAAGSLAGNKDYRYDVRGNISLKYLL
ncbi:MAG: hypothetical protein JXA07_14190 [Spirochaetes bacterium]|nr:hypothetical protein [Spirochaetota bacterium]